MRHPLSTPVSSSECGGPVDPAEGAVAVGTWTLSSEGTSLVRQCQVRRCSRSSSCADSIPVDTNAQCRTTSSRRRDCAYPVKARRRAEDKHRKRSRKGDL